VAEGFTLFTTKKAVSLYIKTKKNASVFLFFSKYYQKGPVRDEKTAEKKKNKKFFC